MAHETSTPEHELNARLLRYRSQPESQDPLSLVTALLSAQRYGDARGVAVSAQPDDADNTRLLLLEGQAWLLEGHLDRALDRFAAAATLEPNEAAPYQWLGRALLLRSDPLRAVHALAKALSLKPDCNETRLALEQAQQALSEAEAAAQVAPEPAATEVEMVPQAAQEAASPQQTADEAVIIMPAETVPVETSQPVPGLDSEVVEPWLTEAQEMASSEATLADPACTSSWAADSEAVSDETIAASLDDAAEPVEAFAPDPGQQERDGSEGLEQETRDDAAATHATSPGIGPAAPADVDHGRDSDLGFPDTTSAFGDIDAPDASLSAAGDLSAPTMRSSAGELDSPIDDWFSSGDEDDDLLTESDEDIDPSGAALTEPLPESMEVTAAQPVREVAPREDPYAAALEALYAAQPSLPLVFDAPAPELAPLCESAPVENLAEAAAEGAGTIPEPDPEAAVADSPAMGPEVSLASAEVAEASWEMATPERAPHAPASEEVVVALDMPASEVCASALPYADFAVELNSDGGSPALAAASNAAVEPSTLPALPRSPEGAFRMQPQDEAVRVAVAWDGPVVGAFSRRPAEVAAASRFDDGDLSDEDLFSGDEHSDLARTFFETEPVVYADEARDIPSLRPIDVPVRQNRRRSKRAAPKARKGWPTGLSLVLVSACAVVGYGAMRVALQDGASRQELTAWTASAPAQIEAWASAVRQGVATTVARFQAKRPPTETTSQASTSDAVEVQAETAPPAPAATTAAPSTVAATIEATPSEQAEPAASSDVEAASDISVAAGMALLNGGDLDGAKAVLAQLGKAERRDEPAQLLKAEVEISEGHAARALRTLEGLREQPERSTAFLATLGRALYAHGQINRAAGAFDLALQQDPSWLSALVGRAEIHVRAERPSDAIALLERGRAIAKRNGQPESAQAKVLTLLGHAFLQRGQAADRDLAYHVLREAIALQGVPVEAHFWLGESLGGRRTPEATRAYTEYLSREPQGKYAQRARRALGPLL